MKFNLITLIRIKFILILIVTINSLGFAFNIPDVDLKGEVLSLELNSENETSISFNISVQMKFLNQSNSPILLSNRQPWLNSQMISSSPENLSNGRYIYSFTGYPSNSISPKWEDYRRKLEIAIPPQEHFRYIMPKDVWQFNIETVIEINKEATKGSINGNTIDLSKLMSYPELWMQLEINFWFLNIEPINFRQEKKFGKKLRKKWKKYGYLWLDDIISEPILLDLSSVAIKAK